MFVWKGAVENVAAQRDTYRHAMQSSKWMFFSQTLLMPACALEFFLKSRHTMYRIWVSVHLWKIHALFFSVSRGGTAWYHFSGLFVSRWWGLNTQSFASGYYAQAANSMLWHVFDHWMLPVHTANQKTPPTTARQEIFNAGAYAEEWQCPFWNCPFFKLKNMCTFENWLFFVYAWMHEVHF